MMTDYIGQGLLDDLEALVLAAMHGGVIGQAVGQSLMARIAEQRRVVAACAEHGEERLAELIEEMGDE